MKVTITRVFRGKVETKFGEKDKIGIKTEEHDDKWLSSFQTDNTENWNEGDKVDINITENNGYLNFKPLIPDYESRIVALEEKVFGAKEEATKDITLDDIPV